MDTLPPGVTDVLQAEMAKHPDGVLIIVMLFGALSLVRAVSAAAKDLTNLVSAFRKRNTPETKDDKK